MKHGRFLLRAAAVASASAAVLGTTLTSTLVVAPAASTLPPIRHVFVLMLENESSSSTFEDPGADPYLATQLRSLGAYL
ncbi:MAG TPA: hypothetical protein VKR22_05380, partial [Acidimicrobiales bacterium]|nr:hypothetical protein [Acidimicrobiales bacterium]